jgi:hypothetical protein
MPFLIAISPQSYYWEDSRYAMFISPFIALVLAGGIVAAIDRLSKRGVVDRPSEIGRIALCVVVLAGIGATMLSFDKLSKHVDPNVSSLTQTWGNPNDPTLASINKLEAAGIRFGYADYWVAYKIDLLSNGRLGITVAPHALNRWSQLTKEVGRADSVAMLFVPDPTSVANAQFARTKYIAGPGAENEPTFLARLRQLHIPYHRVTAGLITAVVINQRVNVRQFHFRSTQ